MREEGKIPLGWVDYGSGGKGELGNRDMHV